MRYPPAPPKSSRHWIACLALASTAGCAAGLGAPGPDAPADPLQSWNRSVFQFNEDFDTAVLRPLATAYTEAVPQVARTGVRHFFANLEDAWSAVNSALQLQAGAAGHSTMRVVLNTTFGLAGLLDVATDAGIERHTENFGRTLGHWGVPPGPFFVVPFFGPSTLRDAAALPVDVWGSPVARVSPVTDRNALRGVEVVEKREELLPLTRALDDAALDKYLFVRDATIQRANPGNPRQPNASSPQEERASR